MAVMCDGVDKLFLGDDTLQTVAYHCQDDIPNTCPQSGIGQECGELHAGQSGRDADELTNHGDEAANKSGYDAMLIEILLGIFDFLS